MTGIDGREYAGLIPPRSGRGVIGVIGGTAAMWDDGRQTYTLQWGEGAAERVHGYEAADRADTLIMAIEAIRHDRGHLADPEFIRAALRDGRRLREMILAVEDELVLAAREPGKDGEAVLSLREIGDALEVHHTTVRDRLMRLAAGQRAAWRGWLVKGSAADKGR